jgi:hypothetical protein
MLLLSQTIFKESQAAAVLGVFLPILLCHPDYSRLFGRVFLHVKLVQFGQMSQHLCCIYVLECRSVGQYFHNQAIRCPRGSVSASSSSYCGAQLDGAELFLLLMQRVWEGLIK